MLGLLLSVNPLMHGAMGSRLRLMNVQLLQIIEFTFVLIALAVCMLSMKKVWCLRYCVVHHTL